MAEPRSRGSSVARRRRWPGAARRQAALRSARCDDAAKRRLLRDKYRADLLSTIARSCVFWSVVQATNFRFLPQQYGVVWTNGAFVIWTTFLCLIGNRAPVKKE